MADLEMIHCGLQPNSVLINCGLKYDSVWILCGLQFNMVMILCKLFCIDYNRLIILINRRILF